MVILNFTKTKVICSLSINITNRIAGIEVEKAVCPPNPQWVKGSGQEVSKWHWWEWRLYDWVLRFSEGGAPCLYQKSKDTDCPSWLWGMCSLRRWESPVGRGEGRSRRGSRFQVWQLIEGHAWWVTQGVGVCWLQNIASGALVEGFGKKMK